MDYKEFDREQLEKIIVEQRPMIKAWKTKITQNNDKISLANRNYWPDITISLAYTQRDVLQNGSGGVDFLTGGVSLNIPLYFWRKQDKAIEENRFRKIQTEEIYQNIYMFCYEK
jgi:outer membrane protein TolC